MYVYAPRPTPLTALHARRPVARWRLLVRRAVLLAAAFVLTIVFMSQVVHGEGAAGQVPVTVHAGDTLWSIAASRYPGSDTRQRVGQIMRANGLKSPVVYPGEQLEVPAG